MAISRDGGIDFFEEIKRKTQEAKAAARKAYETILSDCKIALEHETARIHARGNPHDGLTKEIMVAEVLDVALDETMDVLTIRVKATDGNIYELNKYIIEDPEVSGVCRR